MNNPMSGTGHRRKKIGLLGGTFDPLHMAHLHMAEVAKDECELDEVWFIPAKQPPHKQAEAISSAEDRLAMLRLALDPISYFKLCTLEMERNGPSYTIDTVLSLKADYPMQQFFFIIGGDMWQQLDQWYRIEQLSQHVTFIVLSRPGYKRKPEHSVHFSARHVDMIPLDISSTLIRARVRDGKSIRFLVPEPVREYIKKRGLYVAEHGEAEE